MIKSTRKTIEIVIKVMVVLILAKLVLWACWMPGQSSPETKPPTRSRQTMLQDSLKSHVMVLAGEIGMRNFDNYDNLCRAATYITMQLQQPGLMLDVQNYQIPPTFFKREWPQGDYGKQNYRNIIAEVKGTAKPNEIVIVGAHYDSVALERCRGANDNASGVAATIEMAKYYAARPQNKTLRFVAFVNEEPPFFWTPAMGSYVYAQRCKKRAEKITAMISMESIGYYSDRPGSQHYPMPMLKYIYPDRGNFIGFVGNTESAGLVRDAVNQFRQHSKMPSQAAALPSSLPGIGDSDQWSFWQMGYPAMMVTDTAPCRDPGYHSTHDDPERLDYARMALVVEGMKSVIAKLAE